MDSVILHMVSYQIAFLRDDKAAMDQQLTWGAGRIGEEDWLLSMQADTDAYYGHLARARELSRRAAEMASRADATETAAFWQANSALREAEFGNGKVARQDALAALALLDRSSLRTLITLALARANHCTS
jgi:eukaryotic-like serine/threonine-protein kinase